MMEGIYLNCPEYATQEMMELLISFS